MRGGRSTIVTTQSAARGDAHGRTPLRAAGDGTRPRHRFRM